MIEPRQTILWLDSRLYPIVSSCGLNDSMIHLDKLLRVVGLIILVDVPGLELFWPDNLPE
jgi:hypothetical protein